MTDIDVKAVRRRCLHYQSPEVASHAGLSLAELRHWVAGEFSALGGPEPVLADWQVLALARRVGCCDAR